MDALIRNLLRRRSRSVIDELEWMSPATKARRKDKLAKFTREDRLSRPVA